MAIALLLAAGRGERLGRESPKALVELAGRPLLHWSLKALRESPEVAQIVVALPAGGDPSPGGGPPPGGSPALGGGDPSPGGDLPRGSLPEGLELPAGVVCVPGGAVRSASVRLALAAASPDHDRVLVHDAARPLLTPQLVRRTLAALDDGGCDAAIAASPVSDTIKRASASGSQGALPVVAETLDRTGLWAVQTPQAFRRRALEQALDVDDELLAAATDDAWLVERAGGRVAIVPSGPENVKVTRPVDLRLAELLLAGAD